MSTDNSTYPDKTEIERRRGASASREARAPRRKMAAQILRLAKRLGVDPDVLAARIPAETVRKLKYPVLEETHEDGSRTFKHDPGIVSDGRRSL